VLFLRRDPKVTALVIQVMGFLAKQTEVESRTEPPMRNQILHFFGLHPLKSGLQIPDIPHG
jgi:hypothetical protein